MQVCLGIKQHRCFASCRFVSASPASSAPLLCFLLFCLGISRIICTAVLLFAGLPRHHTHHLHHCFAFCGFASASFAPLPHSAGFLCFCRFASASPASFAPLFCFLRVCFSIICTAATFCRVSAGLPRHHPHHLHRCFAFCVCFSITSIICTAATFCRVCFVRFASASPASSAPLFCFLRVCFSIICTAATFCRVSLFLQVCLSITRIICTAAFAFCGFASASPASFAPLPHSAGCCFVCAGFPRHHPHYLHRCFAFCTFASASSASFAPLFCFLQVCIGITRIICTAVLLLKVCLGITRIICTAGTFCRVLLCLGRFASSSPASFAPLFCF